MVCAFFSEDRQGMSRRAAGHTGAKSVDQRDDLTVPGQGLE